MRMRWFVLLAGCMSAVVACSDSAPEESAGPPEPAGPAISVTTHLAVDSVYFGRTTRVFASASGNAALVAAAHFTWKSSDTTVAVVDTNGVVLGVGLGSARISAEYLGQRHDANVRVVLQQADGGVRFVRGSTTAGDGQCAISENNFVYCRRVQASNDSMPVFRQMLGAAGIQFAEIHTAFGTQCGLSVNGQIYCWGENRRWIFGASQPISAPLAHALKHGALQFASMSAGGHEQICAIAKGTSIVHCWGHNDGFQVGRLPITSADSAVAPMSGNPQALSVSTGNFLTCFVDFAGTIRCGGLETFWLGVGDTSEEGRRTMQPLTGGSGFVSVTVGDQLACGLTAAGAAWCTGRNLGGRLGIGTTDEPATYMLRPVAGGHRFRELSISNTWQSNAVCGVTTDNDLYCWGPFSPTSVSSRLGAAATVPVRLLNGVNVRGIARHISDMCVITLDGRALCW
jgi:hypothetical protein